MNKCTPVFPPNAGWLDYTLNYKEIKYVQKCIDKQGKDIRSTLAGNINSSFSLVDENHWFFTHTLSPLVREYLKHFKIEASSGVSSTDLKLGLDTWWVNYQREHEFNPAHNHKGLFSFVIWWKIPTDYKEQNKNAGSNTPVKSCFQLQYLNLLGDTCFVDYCLNPVDAGRMLFFPSRLMHQVYPFYNCSEERVTISGNLCLSL